jgi:predicted RND superfamily exporter protein
MSFLPFVKTVNNVDYFTLKNDPDVKFYDEFKKAFGNDEFFVIAFEKENIFTTKNLTLIKEITDQVEELDEIRRVRSITNVYNTIGSADYFEVKKFLEEIPGDKNELERLKKQAIKNPLYVKNFISPDSRTAAIVIFTQDRPDDENYRKRLLEKVNKILDPYRKQGEKFNVAGWTTTNLSLAEYMKKDVGTFIPITYLVIAVTIYFLFRNIGLTLIALANIAICLGSTMGVFGLTGITLNNVTTIVLPIIMALAVSDTVHIFSHLEKGVLKKFPDKREALTSVLDKVFVPCFFTALTTAIGFFSFVTSNIPPIKDFAYMGTVGMLFSYVYAFFFVPPLLLLLPPEKIYVEHKTQKGMTNFLRQINNLIQRHNKAVVCIGILLCVAAIWFTLKIKVETNLIEYFKANSPVRTSIGFVEKRLSGIGSFDVSLQAKEQDAFKDPKNLKVIEDIQNYIKTIKSVDVTTSFCDFIKDMNESFHDENPEYYRIPETKKTISQYLLLYDAEDVEDFINSTYDRTRISVRISEHSSAAQAVLIREVKDYLERFKYSGLEIRVTGRAVQDVNVISNIVKSQVSSLATTAIPVFIIMTLTLRSIGLGVLSMIPNIFPILLNFGIMGIMGIRLDTSTALIAALALGIAVDDTTHFLYEYKQQRAEKVSIPNAVEHAMLTKGLAMFSTAITMFIGFGVLVLSRFIPTINYGILNALIMVTGSVGDFFFLTAIILLKKGKPAKIMSKVL